MTRNKALEVVQQGKKVTHPLLSFHEYVSLGIDKKIYLYANRRKVNEFKNTLPAKASCFSKKWEIYKI